MAYTSSVAARATNPSVDSATLRVVASRNRTHPITRPAATPRARPTTRRTTTSSTTHPPNQAPSPAEPDTAMAIAALVNGNASASLSPASEVRAKRTSSSSSSPPGGPTCTSLASTGSVGASDEPSSSAAAGTSPASHQPRTATAAIESGIATSRRRRVVAHARQPIRRSSFNPAPIREMITTSSVIRSTRSPSASGSAAGRCSGRENTPMPSATYTIGNDSGRPASSSGSTDAPSMAAPTKARLIR